MRHCETADLALAALGEPLPAPQTAHLAGCTRCRDQVHAFAAVVAAVRVTVPEGPDVVPPTGVWARIAAAAGVPSTPLTA